MKKLQTKVGKLKAGYWTLVAAVSAMMISVMPVWAADKTVKEIVDVMVKAGVPVAPVNSIVELAEDEHIAGARDMFPTLNQKGIGEFRVTNIPVRFSRSGLAPLESAPALGEDNEEVFASLGRTPEEIQKLREDGVI